MKTLKETIAKFFCHRMYNTHKDHGCEMAVKLYMEIMEEEYGATDYEDIENRQEMETEFNRVRSRYEFFIARHPAAAKRFEKGGLHDSQTR